MQTENRSDTNRMHVRKSRPLLASFVVPAPPVRIFLQSSDVMQKPMRVTSPLVDHCKSQVKTPLQSESCQVYFPVNDLLKC